MQPDKYGEMTVESFEPLISLQIRELVSEPHKQEDCRQEARITVWQILRDRPEMPRSYVAAATRNRIMTVAKTGMMFGMTGVRGKPVDPIRRRPADIDTVRDLGVRDDDLTLAVDVQAAIRQLPLGQRIAVYERFYEGRPWADLSVSQSAWTRPRRGAKARLREALKDLAA